MTHSAIDNTSIQIEIKTVYGNETIYPACETSKLFAELTGKKTLSRVNISVIKQLGYSVTVKQVEL
jgi:hypothetical protein